MSDPSAQQAKARPIWQAVSRGIMCKCPNCGVGKLFDGYLEQVANCPHCGEPLSRYNVGLLLPLLVGMLIIFLFACVFLIIELAGGATPGSYLTILLPLSVVAALLALRPCKGGLIGFMWALRTSDEQER